MTKPADSNALPQPVNPTVPVTPATGTSGAATAPIAPASETGAATTQPNPKIPVSFAKKGLPPKASPALAEAIRKAEKEKEKLANTSVTGAGAASNSEPSATNPFPDEPDPPAGPRYKAMIRVRIADKEFSSLNGDFLGSPEIACMSRQYSRTKFILNDPDGSIFQSLNDKSEVFVQIGFAGGEKRTKFKGKIFSIGRRPPDGTVVVAVDPSAAMAGAANAAAGAAEKPQAAALAPTPIAAAGTVASDGSGTKKGFDPKGLKIEEALRKARANLPTGTAAATSPTTGSATTTAATTSTATGSNATKPENTTTTTVGGIQGATSTTAVGTNPIAPTVVSSATPTPVTQPARAASTDPLGELITETVQEAQNTRADLIQFPTAERLSASVNMGGHRLQFANESRFDLSNGGEILLQQSRMAASVMQAISQGDIVLWDGDKVKQVGPGQGTSSGLVLDWSANRAAFSGVKPEILKRSPLQLSSGAGALTVLSPDIKNKTTNGATVVTPGGMQPLNPNLPVPGMDDIKLGDPIFAGCRYTWADAFRNGERMPETQEVVKGVLAIAQHLEKFSAQKYGTRKFEITSWYRDPATNMAVSSSGADGPHTTGTGVDFYLDGFQQFHDELLDSWEGGLAASASGQFVHLDLLAKRRWDY